MIILNEANFEVEALKSEQPVLVDFFATWCPPCRKLAPIVEEIAEDYAGRVKVAKLNIDEARSVAIKYGVSSIPTLILFKNGEPIDRIVGYVPKQDVEKLLG